MKYFIFVILFFYTDFIYFSQEIVMISEEVCIIRAVLIHYFQLIVILAIISVIVEQSNRNNQIHYLQPQHDQSPVQKSASGVSAHPTGTIITAICFQHSKQNNGDVL